MHSQLYCFVFNFGRTLSLILFVLAFMSLNQKHVQFNTKDGCNQISLSKQFIFCKMNFLKEFLHVRHFNTDSFFKICIFLLFI